MCKRATSTACQIVQGELMPIHWKFCSWYVHFYNYCLIVSCVIFAQRPIKYKFFQRRTFWPIWWTLPTLITSSQRWTWGNGDEELFHTPQILRHGPHHFKICGHTQYYILFWVDHTSLHLILLVTTRLKIVFLWLNYLNLYVVPRTINLFRHSLNR